MSTTVNGHMKVITKGTEMVLSKEGAKSMNGYISDRVDRYPNFFAEYSEDYYSVSEGDTVVALETGEIPFFVKKGVDPAIPAFWIALGSELGNFKSK